MPLLAKPIKVHLKVPGSKSLMNRAVLCAALANGRSIIQDVIYCEDTIYMLDALNALGISIRRHTDHVVVFGNGGRFVLPRKPIYIGNAGTVRRFLAPHVPVGVLVGNARMQQRPIADLEQAIHQLTVQHQVKITGNISSQFISALLMYAPTLKKPAIIYVTGKLVSAPYVQMTIEIMKRFGVIVEQQGSKFIIQPQRYQATRYQVEGDASSATYWWALAAISSSHISVDNIPVGTLQPDARFKQVLAKMGCVVQGNTVIGPWDRSLKPVRVHMSDYPDAVMSAAIVMSQAQGKSTITGIEHLAHKETDRLALLKLNLRKLGISAHTTNSSITITGRTQKLWQTEIKTGDDHRFAMAFSLLGCRVDNKACVKKSYPTFWQDLKRLQQWSNTQTIVLTGMRGVGKTTYGKQLAKRHKAKFIDTDRSLKFGGDWQEFRNQEHAVVKRIAKKTNTIISTGGGTLMYSRNLKLLQQHYILLLTAPLTTLKQRLAKQTHRPALTKGKTVLQELTSVWKERQPKYLTVADNVYDCR